MDIKVTGNFSVYQKSLKNKSAGERPVAVPKNTAVKGRSDEIVFSADALKQREAALASTKVYEQMGQATRAARVSEIKQQVQNGAYQISPEAVAGKMLTGF